MESLQGLVTSWLLFKVVDGNEVIVVPKSIENQIIKEAHILPAGNYKFLTATFLDSAYGKKIGQIINNCVKCILLKKKVEKKEC